MDLDEAIKQRRSIRKYKDAPIPRKDIEGWVLGTE